MIENAVAYFTDSFKKHFSKQIQNLPVANITRKNEQLYVQLLKEDMLLPGETVLYQRNYKDYNIQNRIRHFDRIIDRPFVEVLLKSFYFSTDAVLQNHIVELIEKFNTQRFTFKSCLNQI